MRKFLMVIPILLFYLFVELDGMIDWFMFCGMNWPQNIKRTSSKLRF